MHEDWALCVGVGGYLGGSRLEQLPGAIEDAKRFYDWVVDPSGGGVPRAQAELILTPTELDPADPDPTSSRIEQWLLGMVRRARANDASGAGFRVGRRLYLFYSGHGLMFGGEGETGLLTADAELPDLLPHVAGRAWAEYFRRAAAFDEVVLFMDCCRKHAPSTPPRAPAVKPRKADPAGRSFYAFAVSEGTSALEVEVDGKSMGRFTHTLLGLLRDPPERPLSARAAGDLLEERAEGADIYPPKLRSQDFDLLPPAEGEEAIEAADDDDDIVIAHGESTMGMASDLAEALGTRRRRPVVVHAGELMAGEPRAPGARGVRKLLVTRDSLGAEDLRQLMDHVKPERAVFFAPRDPGIDDIPNLTFVPRSDEDPGGGLPQVGAALAGRPTARLRLKAHEPVARLRVWGPSGRMVGDGRGRLELGPRAHGRYTHRVSLGAHSRDGVVDLTADTDLDLDPLELPSFVGAHRWEADGVAVFHEGLRDAPRATPAVARTVLTLSLPDGGALSLSLPRIDGWRAEVRVGQASTVALGLPQLGVRLVAATTPVGEPVAADHLREALRLALTERDRTSADVSVELVADDPIAALLAAALASRAGRPARPLLATAAGLLGPSDPDVALLSGGGEVAVPPLLAESWSASLRRGTLRVAEGSLADELVGRRLDVEPFLLWDASAGGGAPWLWRAAQAAWPGWDSAPDRDLASSSLADAAPALDAPADSVRRRTYKAPPIERLVQHERVSFVGASNDQLAAALAVAFVERGKRRWEHLELWFLDDEPLLRMVSDGRSGPTLLRARQRAERQLLDLLPVVAESWRACRYGGLRVDGTWRFASLWDAEAPGGYVHDSPYDPGTDVRTSEATDQIWPLGGSPPGGYRALLDAVAALQPTEILGEEG